MIQVQTPKEAKRRARAMQEALARIDALLRSAPVVPLEPGRTYRIKLWAQAVHETGWPPPVSHARTNSERAEPQVIEGILQRWFRLSEGAPRNAQLLLTKPGTGKAAIFAETDVLEYEEITA